MTFLSSLNSKQQIIQRFIPDTTNYSANRCQYMIGESYIDIWFNVKYENNNLTIVENVKEKFGIEKNPGFAITSGFYSANNLVHPAAVLCNENKITMAPVSTQFPSLMVEFYGYIKIPIK